MLCTSTATILWLAKGDHQVHQVLLDLDKAMRTVSRRDVTSNGRRGNNGSMSAASGSRSRGNLPRRAPLSQESKVQLNR